MFEVCILLKPKHRDVTILSHRKLLCGNYQHVEGSPLNLGPSVSSWVKSGWKECLYVSLEDLASSCIVQTASSFIWTPCKASFHLKWCQESEHSLQIFPTEYSWWFSISLAGNPVICLFLRDPINKKRLSKMYNLFNSQYLLHYF